jgi:predicted Zn-dependent protease with MMP-like domain
MAYPVFREQNSSEIAMPLENNPEKIENLALEPVRGLPDIFDGRHVGIVAGKIHFQDDRVLMGVGIQVVDDLDNFLFGQVNGGQVGEDLTFQLGIVPQIATNFDDRVRVSHEIGIENAPGKFRHSTGEFGFEPVVYLLGLHV